MLNFGDFGRIFLWDISHLSRVVFLLRLSLYFSYRNFLGCLLYNILELISIESQPKKDVVVIVLGLVVVSFVVVVFIVVVVFDIFVVVVMVVVDQRNLPLKSGQNRDLNS